MPAHPAPPARAPGTEAAVVHQSPHFASSPGSPVTAIYVFTARPAPTRGAPRASLGPQPHRPQTPRNRPREFVADLRHSGLSRTPQKTIFCGLEPHVQGTHNPLVPGSNPGGPTIRLPPGRPVLDRWGRLVPAAGPRNPSRPGDGSGEVVRGSARLLVLREVDGHVANTRWTDGCRGHRGGMEENLRSWSAA